MKRLSAVFHIFLVLCLMMTMLLPARALADPDSGDSGQMASGLVVSLESGSLLYRSPKLDEVLGMIEETTYFIVEGISADDNTVWKVSYSGEAAWVSAHELTQFGMYSNDFPEMIAPSGLEFDKTPHTYYVTQDINDHIRSGDLVQAFADTDKYGQKKLYVPLGGTTEVDAEYLDPTWISPADAIYFTEEYEELIFYTVGEEITLSVRADSIFGGDIGYQWFGGNAFFSVTGQTGDTITIPAGTNLDGIEITVVASTPFGASISHTFRFVSSYPSDTFTIDLIMPQQTTYSEGVTSLSASGAILSSTDGIYVHPEGQIAVTHDGLTLYYIVISPKDGYSLSGLTTSSVRLFGGNTENMRVLSVYAYESYDGEGTNEDLIDYGFSSPNLLNPDGSIIVCIASVPGEVQITKHPGAEEYVDGVFHYGFSASADNASKATWYILYPTDEENGRWASTKVTDGEVFFTDPFDHGEILLGYAYTSFNQGQAYLSFDQLDIYGTGELFQGFVVCVFENTLGEVRVSTPASLGWGLSEHESEALQALGIQNQSADYSGLAALLDQAEAEHFTEFKVTSGYCSTEHTVTAFGDLGTTISYTMPAGDHCWTEWETTQPVSCTVDGSMNHYCELCGNYETVTIPAFGHTDQENDGYCDVCGQLLSDTSSPLEGPSGAEPVVYYSILEGANGVFTRGGSLGLVMISDMPLEKFSEVLVDDEIVDAGCYDIRGKEVKIAFTTAYLESLGTGPHFLKIRADDGIASCLFTVAEKDGTGLLKVLEPFGDPALWEEDSHTLPVGNTTASSGVNPVIWIILAVIILILIVIILLIIALVRRQKQS